MTFTKFQVAAAKRAALSIKQLERQRESMLAKIDAVQSKYIATKTKIEELTALQEVRMEEMKTLTINVAQIAEQTEQFNAPFVTTYGMTAEEIANGKTEPTVVVEEPAEMPAETTEVVDDDAANEPYIADWPNDVIGYVTSSEEVE